MKLGLRRPSEKTLDLVVGIVLVVGIAIAVGCIVFQVVTA